MEKNERIQAHILSVWRESKKLFSIHGTEGMIILTDKHLMFINKTEAKMRWWNAATQRQVLTFLKSKDVMIKQDGYDEEQLRIDLENKKNMEIKFDDILKINSEEKTWEGVLNLEIKQDEKKTKISVFCCSRLGKISNKRSPKIYQSGLVIFSSIH